MAFEPPQSAKLIPIRPMRGVHRSVPTQRIPVGGFYRLENAIVTDWGLLRRPALTRRGVGTAVEGAIQDIVSVWRTDGYKLAVVVTDKFMYRFPVATTPTLVEWEYWENVDLSVSSAGVVTLATHTTGFVDGDVLTGDAFVITFTDAVLGVITRTWYVDTVVNAYTLTLLDYDYATAIEISDNTAWYIQKTLTPGNQPFIDYTIVGKGAGSLYGGILFAGGKRPLIRWDADTNTLAYWTTDTAKMFGGVPLIPDAVVYFMDRVWVAAVYNTTDAYKRQRIIWSTLADSSNFSVTTNYLDLPYRGSSILRLVPMGNHLVAYFSDGIFIGVPTQYPTLPLRFEGIETGGVGLVGPKAVAAWFGGHFFVGTDDIYWLAYGSTAPESIGKPIFRDVMSRVANPARIRVVADAASSSIIFGFPHDGDAIEELWYFHTKLKEWSASIVTVDCITQAVTIDENAWDALTGTWDTLDDSYPTWGSFSSRKESQLLLYGNAGFVWRENVDSDADFGTAAIPVVVETGDLDFDIPDAIKTVLRFNTKIDRTSGTEDVVLFAVSVSTDKGRTWRLLGNLRIGANADEGKIDFRATGSTLRFRLTSSTMTTAYTIAEMGLMVVGVGDELTLPQGD